LHFFQIRKSAIPQKIAVPQEYNIFDSKSSVSAAAGKKKQNLSVVFFPVFI